MSNPATGSGRSSEAGGEPAGQFYGHPSAEHLEYWLDDQVFNRQLTPAQARLFLPGYEPPLAMGYTISRPDEDVDDDAYGHR